MRIGNTDNIILGEIVSRNPSSQDGRLEVSNDWPPSEIIINDIEAARIERAVRAMPSVGTRGVPTRTNSPAHESSSSEGLIWKSGCHTAALICGVFCIPSFSFLYMGMIGLVIPGALLLASLFCWAVAKKPNEQSQRNDNA